jgi:hypothetical protein
MAFITKYAEWKLSNTIANCFKVCKTLTPQTLSFRSGFLVYDLNNDNTILQVTPVIFSRVEAIQCKDTLHGAIYNIVNPIGPSSNPWKVSLEELGEITKSNSTQSINGVGTRRSNRVKKVI